MLFLVVVLVAFFFLFVVLVVVDKGGQCVAFVQYARFVFQIFQQRFLQLFDAGLGVVVGDGYDAVCQVKFQVFDAFFVGECFFDFGLAVAAFHLRYYQCDGLFGGKHICCCHKCYEADDDFFHSCVVLDVNFFVYKNSCFFRFRQIENVLIFAVECPSESDVCFGSGDGSPCHRGVEVGAKGVFGADNRILLFEVGHVFGADVYAPRFAVVGDLRHQLRIPFEVAVPQRVVRVGVGHSAASVELCRNVELPFFERRLVRCGYQAFETVGERFFA